MKHIKVEHSGQMGMVWIAGWLFSIGFLQLDFFKGLLAILLWPYFIGAQFAVSF